MMMVMAMVMMRGGPDMWVDTIGEKGDFASKWRVFSKDVLQTWFCRPAVACQWWALGDVE